MHIFSSVEQPMDFWGLPWTFPGITRIYGHAWLLRGFWRFKFRSAPGLFFLLVNKWFSGFTTDYIYMHYIICNITDYIWNIYVCIYIIYTYSFPKGFYVEIISHTLKNTTYIIRNETTSMFLFTKKLRLTTCLIHHCWENFPSTIKHLLDI